MNSLRARLALVLLNFVLLGLVVWLGKHALKPLPLPELDGGRPLAYGRPMAYAIDDASRVERGDLPKEIGAGLDRPLPPAAATPEGPPPPPPAALGASYRLLLVSEDRDDPGRSTAIVGATGGPQRTVTIGEQLDGFMIIHIGLEGDGGLLTGERDGRREDLRTERSPRM